eukprot:NODE_2954_length_1057_cov_30.332258_g2820_i0.p1 GENE.NODE_2954_length_1057_cov_30.332258_g2820_i0~~NODE_2954_length_1057_cov_30.332258_g2820_i0.p1  ORF type:complete len:328 (-),score=69.82 NODE_2954_length_1057_cov_30.332258_g2820_i0:74-1057(-)
MWSCFRCSLENPQQLEACDCGAPRLTEEQYQRLRQKTFEKFPPSVHNKLPSNSQINKEFTALECITAALQHIGAHSHTSQLPANAPFNRYSDILPNEATRVHLRSGNYINANWIEGFGLAHRYLCTQAPESVGLARFFEMVWEAGVQLILMLTKTTESGVLKALPYWPAVGATATYGPFTVTTTSETTLPQLQDVTQRCLQVTCGEEEARQVAQYHYTGWPDFGIPAHPNGVSALLKLCDDHLAISTSPILLHCSAGVGRTGVLAAAHITLSQFSQSSPRSRRSFRFSLVQTVTQLRECRNHLLQSPQQLAFCYEVILHEIHNRLQH